MSFLDDRAIRAALSQRCVSCLAPVGEECRDENGTLLMETKARRPVHIARLEP